MSNIEKAHDSVTPREVRHFETGSFDGFDFSGSVKRLSFKGARLTNVVFPNDVKSLRFEDCHLENVHFDSLVARVDFSNSTVVGCSFNGAKIEGDFILANIEFCSFEGASLKIYADASITNCGFTRSTVSIVADSLTLTGNTFVKCVIEDSKFVSATIDGEFKEVFVNDVEFGADVVLEGVTVSDFTMMGVSLQRTSVNDLAISDGYLSRIAVNDAAIKKVSISNVSMLPDSPVINYIERRDDGDNFQYD